MAGDFKRLLEEFQARPLYDEEEAKAAQAADRQQTRGTRVRESLGGVSDALYSAFTRAPVRPMQPMTALPSAEGALANRQRGAGMEQERRMRLAEAGHRVETDEAKKAAEASKRQALADVLPRIAQAYGLDEATAKGLSPDNYEALLGAEGARLTRDQAEKRAKEAARQSALDRGSRERIAGVDAAAKEKAAAAVAAQGRGKASGELRKELQGLPEVKSFQEVRMAYEKMQKAASAPSAAGDLALIFSFMKMLDPGSTVREGEFANAQNAAGVPERVLAQYNKMLSGERLTPETRSDFMGQARNFYGAHANAYQQRAQQYRGLAERTGVAPEDVVLGDTQAGSFNTEAPMAAPQPAAQDADRAAMQWALDNMDDPRAAAILQANGVSP